MARALSPREHLEYGELASRYAHLVHMISGYRNTVTIEILGEDGYASEWMYIDGNDPPWKLVKTVQSKHALHFQSRDIWRYAALEARKLLASVQKHCKDRQVERRRPPGSPSKRTKKKLEMLRQGTLPLELRTKEKTAT